MRSAVCDQAKDPDSSDSKFSVNTNDYFICIYLNKHESVHRYSDVIHSFFVIRVAVVGFPFTLKGRMRFRHVFICELVKPKYRKTLFELLQTHWMFKSSFFWTNRTRQIKKIFEWFAFICFPTRDAVICVISLDIWTPLVFIWHK